MTSQDDWGSREPSFLETRAPIGCWTLKGFSRESEPFPQLNFQTWPEQREKKYDKRDGMKEGIWEGFQDLKRQLLGYFGS